MKIAGIYNGHDTSFSVFENGKPLIHAEYERYLRLKEPKADSYKFMKTVIDIEDIDMWVTVCDGSNPGSEFQKSDKSISYTVGHHTSHAANAFFSSNMNEALIITIDGGEGDLFVDISEVKGDLKERDRVSFEIEEEKNRKKAINVTLL